ncbi:coiled-coil domain-containing protein [Atopobium fossor]|uniref:hypothetical protein n=1 Tax=Atopobium fossor TaxID=39487 RepID=UPI000400DB6E|nr:hypothetical protein [Atopobium fossor]
MTDELTNISNTAESEDNVLEVSPETTSEPTSTVMEQSTTDNIPTLDTKAEDTIESNSETPDDSSKKLTEDVATTLNKKISSVASSLSKEDLSKLAGKARETLSASASQGANTVMEGFEAVRDVRRAAKQTDAARNRLKQVHNELDESNALLAHREEIAQNYESIVEDQTALLIEAQNRIKKLAKQIKSEQTKEEKLKEQLAQLRETNKHDLRPHKIKLEQARDKVDEASKAVADAKRAMKLAESQHKEVVGRRDEEINHVNQAIEKSTARIEELNVELATLTAADTPDENALKHMRKSISKEERALDYSRSEIDEINEQHRRAIENALTHVYTQRNSLEFAQETLDEAKREVDEHKATYDKLYKNAHNRESEIDKQLATLAKTIADIQNQHDEAIARRDTAQSLIDEAEDVHATPEVTEELRNTISDTQAAIEVQQRQVQNLERREAKLREKTKQQRTVFIGVTIAAGIVVLLALLFITNIL